MAINQSKASVLIEQHPRLKTALDHLIHLIESSTEANPLVSNISNVVLPVFGNALTDAVRACHIPTPILHPAHTPPITPTQSEQYRSIGSFDAWPLLAEAVRQATPRPSQIPLFQEGAHGH